MVKLKTVIMQQVERLQKGLSRGKQGLLEFSYLLLFCIFYLSSTVSWIFYTAKFQGNHSWNQMAENQRENQRGKKNRGRITVEPLQTQKRTWHIEEGKFQTYREVRRGNPNWYSYHITLVLGGLILIPDQTSTLSHLVQHQTLCSLATKVSCAMLKQWPMTHGQEISPEFLLGACSLLTHNKHTLHCVAILWPQVSIASFSRPTKSCIHELNSSHWSQGHLGTLPLSHEASDMWIMFGENKWKHPLVLLQRRDTAHVPI